MIKPKSMIAGKYTVFLADDSEDDRLFLRKALERSSRLLTVGEASDGQETVEYLSGVSKIENKEHVIPDLLLLDIKMPRKTGHDVLEWIRTQSFQQMKVVMVSGSWLAEDISKCSALGAAAYFKKTSLRHEQDEMVRAIEILLDGVGPS